MSIFDATEIMFSIQRFASGTMHFQCNASCETWFQECYVKYWNMKLRQSVVSAVIRDWICQDANVYVRWTKPENKPGKSWQMIWSRSSYILNWRERCARLKLISVFVLTAQQWNSFACRLIRPFNPLTCASRSSRDYVRHGQVCLGISRI